MHDDDLTSAEAWAMFASTFNADELIDELALASREGPHGKAAYNLLRAASDTTIGTLETRLFVIDARSRPWS